MHIIKDSEYIVDTACISCAEGLQLNDCPKSKKLCGHHSNSSWCQDICSYCGEEFGEELSAEVVKSLGECA